MVLIHFVRKFFGSCILFKIWMRCDFGEVFPTSKRKRSGSLFIRCSSNVVETACAVYKNSTIPSCGIYDMFMEKCSPCTNCRRKNLIEKRETKKSSWNKSAKQHSEIFNVRFSCRLGSIYIHSRVWLLSRFKHEIRLDSKFYVLQSIELNVICADSWWPIHRNDAMFNKTNSNSIARNRTSDTKYNVHNSCRNIIPTPTLW